MSDIHIRDFDRTAELSMLGSDQLYPVLCGQSVEEKYLSRLYSWSEKPTCMGCILVRFQNRAKEKYGT